VPAQVKRRIRAFGADDDEWRSENHVLMIAGDRNNITGLLRRLTPDAQATAVNRRSPGGERESGVGSVSPADGARR
jgi:hypothetical protein